MQKLTTTLKRIGKVVLFMIDPMVIVEQMVSEGCDCVQLKTY